MLIGAYLVELPYSDDVDLGRLYKKGPAPSHSLRLKVVSTHPLAGDKAE